MKNIKVLPILLVFVLSILTGCGGRQDSAQPEILSSSPSPPSAQGEPAHMTNAVNVSMSVKEKANEQHFRFVVSADSRGEKKNIHEEDIRSVMRRIKALKPQPSFMVTIGDLIRGSEDAKTLEQQYDEWKSVASEFYPLQFYYPAVGNHEMIMRDQGGLDAFDFAFKDTFTANFYGHGYGRSVYYFDYGDARFFVVNNYHPAHRHSVAPDVIKWLKDNTDKRKAFHFVFAHAPGWPTGAHVNSSMDKYPDKRNAFWEVVDAMPGALFFAGHEHNYSRTQIDSTFSEIVNGTHYAFKNTVQQVVVGGFGSKVHTRFKSRKGVIVKPQPVCCYAVIDVYSDRVHVRAYDVSDNILDDFTVTR